MNEKDFIKIDTENIEPVEFSDWEKKKIEKRILRSSKTHSNKSFKWVATIAMIIVIATGNIIWNPVVAERLPIIQQLLQINDNPKLQAFSEHATIINQVDESNGSSIELAEAFFDGNFIAISYEMKQAKPMKENPLLWDGSLEVNGDKLEVGSHQITQKDEYTWIGMFTAKVSDKVYDESIDIQWSPRVFKGIQNTTLIEGDWNYQLELTPTQAYSRKINIPFGNEQYRLLFNKITVGKYATILYFEGDLDKDTEFLMVDIKDNLENIYEDISVTSIENKTGQVTGYVEFFSSDFNVSTFTISPTIRIVDEMTLEKKKLIPLPIIKIPVKKH